MKGTAVIFYGLVLAVVHGRTTHKNVTSKLRIVHGNDATLGEIPYQVDLREKGNHFCGGSIINEYWIVTAAHCVVRKSAFDIDVSAGTVNRRELYSLHKAEQIIVHEKYIPSSFETIVDDIALIKVVTPFEFSFRVQPATLPQPHSQVQTNSSALVSGWGFTMNGIMPDILQKARVYITDPEVCQEAHKEKRQHIQSVHICASDPNTKRGECMADSGGPLTVDGVLVGIISWSIKDLGCGMPQYPGVSTRVSEYVDWINEHIK